MRKSSGFLIASLQIAEIIFIGVSSPLHNISLLKALLDVPISKIRCDFLQFSKSALITSSLWLDLSLAVSRFTAIVTPRHYGRFTMKPAVSCIRDFTMDHSNMPGNLALFLNDTQCRGGMWCWSNRHRKSVDCAELFRHIHSLGSNWRFVYSSFGKIFLVDALEKFSG